MLLHYMARRADARPSLLAGPTMPHSRIPLSLAQTSAAFRVALALVLSGIVWAAVLLVLG
jgi:hypothetical protein